MPSIPPNPIEGPRKRKIPLDDNGEPVQIVKKKVGPGPQKKAKTAPKKTTSATATKLVPGRIPTAGPSQSRARSASVEDILDEIVHSVPPLNPRNILEAADGSDDDEFLVPEKPPPSESAMDVDDETEAESQTEEPEESDEAELSMYLLLIYMKC